MLQIQNPNVYIASLLGKQEIKTDVKYRLLHFCILTPVEEGALLFNNLTKEFVVLSEQEYSYLKDFSIDENTEIFKKLIEKWFLVPEEHNDLELCEQVREFLKITQKASGIRTFTILPTTGCNARCFYCFEVGAPVVTMDDNTADAVTDFIVRNKANKKLKLNWFGGEPLCNSKAIDRISRALTEKGVDFNAQITTNGYLFNEDLVKKAKGLWRINIAQITIDGMADTYNKVKNYINGDKNAFDRVLNNIEMLANAEIYVYIRLNMDKHNAAELFELVECLGNRFKGNKYILIKPALLYEGEEFVTYRTDLERIEITKKAIDLSSYIRELGFCIRNTRLNDFKTAACQADAQESALILPDGHLGFCEHYLTEDFYGTIFEDVKKPFWSDYRKLEERCKTCVALPNCRVLSRCPVSGKGCREYSQHSNIRAIQNSVSDFYKKYKNKMESKLDE